MAKFFLSWAPLASASCILTSKVCTNFPEFDRTQFRDVIGEEHLETAQDQTACLMRAQDFHHWCGNTESISVAATFTPDCTYFYDQSACDAGWSQWQAFCYRFHLDRKTWTEAEESCRAEESHLASVHSMEENRFIHLLAHGLQVWIGYHHQQEQYSWTDHSQEDFTNFAKNCSGREKEADCQPDQVQQKWHSSSGAERSPFVCKRNAKRVSKVQNISVERLLEENWEHLHQSSWATHGQKLPAMKVAEAKSGAQAKNFSGAEFQAPLNSSHVEMLATCVQDHSSCSSTSGALATPRIYHHGLTAMW